MGARTHTSLGPQLSPRAPTPGGDTSPTSPAPGHGAGFSRELDLQFTEFTHACIHSHPSTGVMKPGCDVALGSSGWAMNTSWTPHGVSSRDLYGATELWAQNLLQKISLFNTSSRPILPHTTKRCLAHISGDLSSFRPSLEAAWGCSVLPFDRMSLRLALAEHSTVFKEPGGIRACETSP